MFKLECFFSFINVFTAAAAEKSKRDDENVIIIKASFTVFRKSSRIFRYRFDAL